MTRTLTVREINRLLLTNHPVVVTYEQDSALKQSRIIRARLSQGEVQGKRLGDGQWVTIREAWQA